VYAILLIVILAVTATVITAYLVTRPDGGGTQSPETADSATPTPAPASEVPRLLLDTGTVSEIMGGIELEVRYTGGQLSVPDGRVEPPECAWIDSVGSAMVYADIDWSNVQRHVLSQVGERSPQFADQIVVTVPTPADAKTIVENRITDLEACNGKEFTVDDDKWIMQDYTERDGMAIALAKAQAVEWYCQAVVAAKSIRVVEVQVCGRGTGQAVTMADRILSNPDI
jgi:hypothetical protein